LHGLTSDLAALAWSPIDQHLAIAGGLTPRVWDLSRKSLRLPEVNTDWTIAASWSPDGSRIATGSYDHTARVWDVATGKELQVFSHPGTLSFLAWSPDGKQIATPSSSGASDAGKVSRVWDVASGKLLVEKLGGFSEIWPGATSWSSDGDYIATGFFIHGPIVVWNAMSGETLTTISDPGCVMWPTWSPRDDRLAAGCAFTDPADDNTPARIWDGQTGQLLMTFESHDGESMRAQWSPDGTRLTVTYGKGPVKVWDAVTGKELLTFGGHMVRAWDAPWSPNGKRIASSDDMGNVKVWDANTGAEVMNYRAPGLVTDLDWSPDGKYLLIAGAFKTPIITHVWQSTDELIQYAQECCVLRELTPAERQQFGLAAK
jgi:WD40 repeat protein